MSKPIESGGPRGIEKAQINTAGDDAWGRTEFTACISRIRAFGGTELAGWLVRRTTSIDFEHRSWINTAGQGRYPNRLDFLITVKRQRFVIWTPVLTRNTEAELRSQPPLRKNDLFLSSTPELADALWPKYHGANSDLMDHLPYSKLLSRRSPRTNGASCKGHPVIGSDGRP